MVVVMVVVAATGSSAPKLGGRGRTGQGGRRGSIPLLSAGEGEGDGEGGYSCLVAPGELGSCLMELLLLLRAAAAAPTVWLRV